MVAFTGRYDGSVIIPDQPLDLPRDQRVVVHLERESELPPGTPGAKLLALAGSIPAEDLREMEAAIEEGCERVNEDGW